MPILAIKDEIEIEITHKCNWNCSYCAIHVHQLSEITHNDVLQKLEKIKEESVVTISGGEPGLVKKEFIVQYIQILKNKNCTLYLNTNGTFLFKYPELISTFKEIVYHCSEKISENDVLFRSNIYNNINYMIVVHDDNISSLNNFLIKNKDIKFSIVAATYNKLNDGPTLSKKNRYFIMTKYSDRMTKESIKRMIHEKEFDIMKYM